MVSNKGASDSDRLEKIVAKARSARDERERDYRERALKLYPWVCGRCRREFTRENLHELTVHHRDHNHDNNPSDGSNWELLCMYCHDNEHARYVDGAAGNTNGNEQGSKPGATHQPFAGLGDLLKLKDS